MCRSHTEVVGNELFGDNNASGANKEMRSRLAEEYEKLSK